MVKPFSALQRKTHLAEMAEEELDMLVIGGGITGAGIALDATDRGLNVGLVEMQDFAAGTSSRSTKLVHGGLRYLKQLDFKIVAETGKERAIVYENAPHVTTPEWMMLPIVKGGTYGKAATSVGLKVYDTLAGVRRKERRKMLSLNETLEREPLLRRDKLKGGGVYVEYKTDDARLTLETVKEAVYRGTKAVNYTKAETLLYRNGKVIGARVKDVESGQTYDIYAKRVVNAAGPWVDELREQDGSKTGKYLYLTKGVHVVFDQSRFPLKQAVYFDTENDGRMIFAIPRGNKTYVGTTDTYYKDDITTPRMTEEDLKYLVDASNYMFPGMDLTRDDVESSWTGLRPLIFEEGKSASEISRKDETFESESGLLSIAGGKLTGYRKMAERIVDIVAKEQGVKKKCSTAKIVLSGGDVGGSENLDTFIKEQTAEGKRRGLTEDEARHLSSLFGSNVSRIYELIDTLGEEGEHYGLPKSVFAPLVYSIEEEMAVSPIDFFNRRTGALFFDIDYVEKWKEAVTSYMATRFNWSAEQREAHVNELETELYFAKYPVETREAN
ncbi:glycerol-3-phosphate dehydrogenase/oxidase [Salisediminibacterium halotolerans]|uniref:glycerol-3-phosphate dehydrogenase/oxidase n=1 Tax=Salisediminibacterium halotolerans TaxID=517425 RepID=UPI000EAF0E44|nr:glycerol-3-phosphate dehydrogenase/oxidase [Salisediminibacterium halotolerans]RLJ72345.1 homodimeric glycerol 3-phosphate dehydrogenase (quinone) [Actinophytocola xinjiangensis]RPE85559.1 homodimeric glycerol 3-phosphate dehydrogenase (quinone) [Salisediminibacterium halotolerans]TWG33514.1 homodimeric glycerol 3-phosphate dehydrogenase (quinone) [Salisediminibacterium halotolerans]GEL08525.1 aerobic glycerol-3-phosphate dehydrogenase [Salisediminibacterium halotolerans]